MGDFQKLDVWKEAHKLTLEIYKLTAKLPKSELFILVSQIRRAALFVESNIAKGEGRFGKADKLRFFVDSRVSIKEVQTQLLVIRDLYLELKNDSQEIFDRMKSLLRGLTN